MGTHLLDLPYLTPKRAKGRDYFYYRRSGRWYRLPAPSDPKFIDEYERIHTSFGLTSEPARQGTFGWLVERYKASPEFRDKAPRTQSDYRKILDKLCELWKDLALPQITRNGIMTYRDTLAHSPRQANYVVQVIRLLFSFAINTGIAKENPALRPRKLKEGKGFQPWSDDAVGKFRAANADQEMMLIALEIGLCTGVRGGDLCRMPVTDYRDGFIKTVQSKTGEPIWVPAHPTLRDRLDKIQGRLLMIATPTGRQFKESSFSHAWHEAVVRAGLNGLTFHGLRTTAGTYLAEAGCTDAEIQAVLGQRTPAMAAHYRRYANKKKLAESAITKLRQSRPKV